MIIILFLLLIVAYWLNLFSEKHTLQDIRYERQTSKTIVEIDEEFIVSVKVDNNKFLPVTYLKIEEGLPRGLEYVNKSHIVGDKHITNMSIMPYQRITRKYKLVGKARGRQLMRDPVFSGGDFLGLKVFRKGIDYNNEVVVLPRRADLENDFVVYGDTNGDISIKRWIIEDPILTIGIREYTGFEPQKHIHWPSSLKSGQLMVKQYDYTTDNSVCLMLNVECFKPFWHGTDGEKIEKCIEIVRALAEDLEEQGIQFSFITNAKISGNYDTKTYGYPGQGRRHLDEVLEYLGRVDYSIDMYFEKLIQEVMSGGNMNPTIIIVTPLVLEDYVEYINSLKERCQRLVVISCSTKNLDYLHRNIISVVERGDIK